MTPPVDPPAGPPQQEWDAWSEPRQATSYGRFPAAPVQEPPPSKATAGWALGLSIADCCGIGALVGIGLGVKVLRNSRDGRDHGKGLAIAAIVVGAIRTALLAIYLVVLLVLALTGHLDDVTQDTPNQTADSGWISNQDLRRGDCFDDQTLSAAGRGDTHVAGTVKVVPCARPHQFETFLTFRMPAGDYPGQRAVDRAAVRCLTSFEDYVGTPWRRHGELDVSYYYPTKENWTRGTRSITCNAQMRDGSDLTGTVRGTGDTRTDGRGRTA